MGSFAKTIHQDSVSNIVTIDVGGQIFQTTKQTLIQAGSKSLFSQISNSNNISFIDRDPEIFSLLLSLLRTGNLPSKAKQFDIQDLIFESRFYGIENLLVNSQSQFDPFNLEKSLILPLSGRDSPSVISATDTGSITVANGSKITSFDWSLKRKSTIMTQFTVIDSLLVLSPDIVAAGATDLSGLQIIDVGSGFVKQTLNWENVTRSGSTVQAIGASSDYLFTSFESSRRNSNCIMIYDLNDSCLRAVSEVCHNEIFGADLDSGIPATKLQWIGSYGLLMVSGSHSGPSGVTGNVRFWDIRSGKSVVEIKEKMDCFSDVTFSSTLCAMFKVGVNTGEVYFSDLRKMDADLSWVCLGDERKVENGKKGVGSRIEAHGNNVVCSKGGNLELWSEVVIGSKQKPETVFRKNLMGRAKDIEGNRITNLNFGGNKMFLTRKDQQCIEVWNSAKGV